MFKKKLVSFILTMALALGTFSNAYASNVALLAPKKVNYEGTTQNLTTWMPSVKNYFLNTDSTTDVITVDTFDANKLNTLLWWSNYTLLMSHGAGDGSAIACYDTNGDLLKYNSFSVDYVNNLSDDYYCGLDMCLLGACCSAKGENSITEAVYNKGAKCTIGFSTVVDRGCLEKWMKYYADAFTVGWPVKSSIEYADLKMENECDPDDEIRGWTVFHKTFGDTNVYFKW